MSNYLNNSPKLENDFIAKNQADILRRHRENPAIYKTGPTKYQNSRPHQDGANKGHWTPDEDKQLTEAVGRFNSKCWKKIAECLYGRTDV